MIFHNKSRWQKWNFKNDILEWNIVHWNGSSEAKWLTRQSSHYINGNFETLNVNYRWKNGILSIIFFTRIVELNISLNFHKIFQ